VPSTPKGQPLSALKQNDDSQSLSTRHLSLFLQLSQVEPPQSLSVSSSFFRPFSQPGISVGGTEGCNEGKLDGSTLGTSVGAEDGCKEGKLDGSTLGTSVGAEDGCIVGNAVFNESVVVQLLVQ